MKENEKACIKCAIKRTIKSDNVNIGFNYIEQWEKNSSCRDAKEIRLYFNKYIKNKSLKRKHKNY